MLEIRTPGFIVETRGFQSLPIPGLCCQGKENFSMKIPPQIGLATKCESIDLQYDRMQRADRTQQLSTIDVCPFDFIPLDKETRTHVSTKVMCHHLGRKEQTARGWASAETFPDGLRPLRVRGRLAWPVAGIKRLLGV